MMTSLCSLMLLANLLGTSAGTSQSRADLLGALHDSDPDVRALAAKVLADEDRGPATLPALTELVASRQESWRVRVAAAEALSGQVHEGDAAEETLIDVALDSDDDWRVRAAAVQALREIEGGLVLARALADARAASGISNGSSTVLLDAPLRDSLTLEALGDPDPRMRTLARTVLELAIASSGSDSERAFDEGPWCWREALLALAPPSSPSATLWVY